MLRLEIPIIIIIIIIIIMDAMLYFANVLFLFFLCVALCSGSG